jgi:hypothetical protein
MTWFLSGEQKLMFDMDASVLRGVKTVSDEEQSVMKNSQ